MKTRLTSKLVSALLLIAAPAAFGQRSVMVNSNNSTLIYPTNFWSANAASGRAGLGLGSAATNTASAFQSSSAVLSNLTASNAINLTNLRATNIVGTIALSNVPTIAVASGGTGATNVSDARTNLGLGSAATNASSAFQPASTVLSNVAAGNASGLTNLQAANIVGVLAASNIPSVNFTNVGGVLALANGGTGATNQAAARANLGLAWSALTNTNASVSLLGVSTNGQVLGNIGTNVLTFVSSNMSNTPVSFLSSETGQKMQIVLSDVSLSTGNTADSGSVGVGGGIFEVKYGSAASAWGRPLLLAQVGGNVWETVTSHFPVSSFQLSAPISFGSATISGSTRTNLGLGWAALTNTGVTGFNAALYGPGTNPVLVNASGTVISPANFWANSPVYPVVQSFTPIDNSTNNIANARVSYVFSLSSTIGGVTQTLQLPSGSASEGDVAFVVHNGPPSSTTIVRVQGTTNNLISVSGTGEAVQFVYRNASWGILPNPANVAAIYFSGTAASSNAAISRTNLGLPWPGLTNTNASGLRSSLGLVWSGLTNTNAVAVRNDLGLVLTALTSSSATAFQGEIFTSTNTPPANTTNVNAWVDIRVGTNDFKLPLYK